MTGLLGPDGRPIASSNYKNKKAPAPATGEKFGGWGGPNVSIMSLPGGGAIQFDLDRLTLGDFRQMRDHYQINSSLTLLMFLMHQSEWRIQCSDKKQRDFYTEQLENIWTPLVRSKSQAFWAGYSPNILQWENDVQARRITLGKVKDMIPEEVDVNWKKVDGQGTEKISVYDGIKRWQGKSIPVENTYWYPLLMENGDYKGRKLLRPAFQPWFFSILLHLFANRYYERFGEPTPIGRAPYDDEIRYGGVEMRGNEAMQHILQALRSRSVVVLPNDKTPAGDETSPDFDYQIEYLESQMRGADFERYMTRLDEEMSLGLFTPILMMRTADVGSYNLGTQHSQIYLWMLNAIAGDWKFYLDWYILRPMRDFNFGTNAELPKIIFKRKGSENEQLIRDIVRSLIDKGALKPNTDQLAEMAGIDLTVVRQLTTEGDQPADPADPSQKPDSGADAGSGSKENASPVRIVAAGISDRVEQQIRNACRRGKMREATFDIGFQSRFEDALVTEGIENAHDKTRVFYAMLDQMFRDFRDMADVMSEEGFVTTFRNNVYFAVDTLMGSRK